MISLGIICEFMTTQISLAPHLILSTTSKSRKLSVALRNVGVVEKNRATPIRKSSARANQVALTIFLALFSLLFFPVTFFFFNTLNMIDYHLDHDPSFAERLQVLSVFLVQVKLYFFVRPYSSCLFWDKTK